MPKTRHTSTLRYALSAACLLALAGCLWRESSSGDTTAPTVTAASVTAGATNVALTQAFNITFSEPLDAASVSTATVQLLRGATAATGAVTLAGNTVTFTPSAPLARNAPYTLRATVGVKDVAQNALGTTHDVSFRTRDGVWAVPQLIETDNAGDAGSPRISINASGDAIAVWYQSDGTRDNIWANRYSVGTGWGTAALIETDNVGSASNPQIAIDASGNAVAVWTQSDGVRDNIWANRYSVGTGWGTAALIETDNAGNADGPQIAIDASGNAVAVWYQRDGTRNNIWANRYSLGTGWGTAALIETDNAGDAGAPRIAIDTSGNAIAVWNQHDGTRTNIWANRYAVGTGWGTAALIETDNAGPANSPQISIDVSGNAIAVWTQSDGTRYDIWANRYSVGTGWGTPARIESDDAGDAIDARMAMDASGNAIVVWNQHDGTRTNIWANRYSVGTGWGTAALIETDNAGDANNSQIAIDASGNAIAVWAQNDGVRTNIRANRYSVGIGWGTAALIETDNAGYADGPQIAIDASGAAIAVWYQRDGLRDNILAARFD